MEGNILECNQAYLNMLGYSRKEIKELTYLKLTPAKWHDKDTAIVQSQIMVRGYSDEYEKEYIRKDGTIFPISLRTWLIKDSENNSVGMWAIVRDITEQKRAEEEIRKLNGNLRQRTVEVEAINRELESFSYSVSHDLQSPLRSIDGFSQALFEDCFQKLDEPGKEYLQRIRAATQRMGHVIDDLLNLARVTRSEMQWEEVNLGAMADRIAQELREREPQRQVEWVIQPGLIAHGDGRLLRILLENLLGNAWKFTGKHPRSRIELGVIQGGNGLTYFVRDDGAGFDMAFVDKLFTPFQRLHSVTDFPGTGIGLATVRRIIYRHGGRVWAEGEVEKGATFYFTLEK
jgi:PAS domain S-box-containing protein